MTGVRSEPSYGDYFRHVGVVSRNLAGEPKGLQNVPMAIFLVDFLHRIALGAATVLVVFVVTWIGIRRRTPVAERRRNDR